MDEEMFNLRERNLKAWIRRRGGASEDEILAWIKRNTKSVRWASEDRDRLFQESK